ncbi:GPW/gp25 family protein [Dyadobacter sp. LJ53]|uniref:GPW/gp25 family protein n=1 Tax=Dyadobacter chenwenxiniae TaxID=2906456 RepID=UPI001F2A0DD3|nr:GPW/gp25 family protein [Dyadobacter chenwenxiniae]MCF0048665.1 GPW/gp25 family protein [Dyadobacter chenwenxiniae]
MKDTSFLGTGWGFPPTFRCATGGVDMLSGKEDVESSLHIIISTEVGERIMHPGFGCGLRQFVFEPVTHTTQQTVDLHGNAAKGESTPTEAMLENIVKEAIVLHEPRIIVNKVETYSRPLEGRIEISVEYLLITTNTRYNYVYPFYIHEATNLQL